MTNKEKKQFIDFIENPRVEDKQEFHSLGKKACSYIAKQLNLGKNDFEIRSNKAGSAVRGEVVLHTTKFYVHFGDFSYFRDVSGLKDFCGGVNRLIRLNLIGLDGFCEELKMRFH